MNAEMFRQFYNYHFAMNRFMWNTYITQLTQEQFVQPHSYSMGSVRNHVVHMMSVDDAWFGELQKFQVRQPEPDAFSDRDEIRARWDEIEKRMRDYLATLTDEMVASQSMTYLDEGDPDRNLYMWQVLLHVVNHCTDHRAQVLRMINDMGIDTTAQDYIYYLYAINESAKNER